MMVLISVVLPTPLRPITAMISAGLACIETSLTMRTRP